MTSSFLVILLRTFAGFSTTISICLLMLNPYGCLAEEQGGCSNSSHFFDLTLKQCKQCTNCEALSLDTFSNCTSTSDSVCYRHCQLHEYYSAVDDECVSCSNCTATTTDCTPVSDRVCICNKTELFNKSSNSCQTNCSMCPDGCNEDRSGCACGTDEFWDSTSSTCSACSTCPINEGLHLVKHCSVTEDAVCQRICPDHQYYDITTRNCSTCTDCSLLKTDQRSECTAVSDAVCCDSEIEFYNPSVRDCTPNCAKCPTGSCSSESFYRCECLPCQTGRYCETQMSDCPSTEAPKVGDSSTRPTEAESVPISPVASALIALGAVVGIILFSALFVLLGVVSSCHRNQNSTGDSTSNHSTERILEDGKGSRSTLLAMYGRPGGGTLPSTNGSFEYKTSFDYLKQSGSGRSLNSSSVWSASPRSSPVSSTSVLAARPHPAIVCTKSNKHGVSDRMRVAV